MNISSAFSYYPFISSGS